VPIRPENRDRYPEDWPQIAEGLKAGRAGWRCECDGRCGRGHVGRCPERHAKRSVLTRSERLIVLTTAHLDHTPENCDPDNLLVMCAGCHLFYDRDHHDQSRVQREDRERREAGQLPLDVTAADTTRGSVNTPDAAAAA